MPASIYIQGIYIQGDLWTKEKFYKTFSTIIGVHIQFDMLGKKEEFEFPFIKH